MPKNQQKSCMKVVRSPCSATVYLVCLDMGSEVYLEGFAGLQHLLAISPHYGSVHHCSRRGHILKEFPNECFPKIRSEGLRQEMLKLICHRGQGSRVVGTLVTLKGIWHVSYEIRLLR